MERCYRLADFEDTIDCRGEASRDALVRLGYGVVAEIDCDSGTITSGADEDEIARGEKGRAEFDALPPEEQRALRRAVGGVSISRSTPDVGWGDKKASPG